MISSKEEFYQASVREGQAAARACRRAWANYHKRRGSDDRKTRRARDKLKADMAGRAYRMMMTEGDCTLDDLQIGLGFPADQVQRHGEKALETARDRRDGRRRG